MCLTHPLRPPPSLSSYICLILQCTHSPSLLHDTVDGMMAPPGSALYHKVSNETYNCLRPAHLHTSVPPSKAQKLITRYLLLLEISLNQGAGKSSLSYVYSVFLHQHIHTSTIPHRETKQDYWHNAQPAQPHRKM